MFSGPLLRDTCHSTGLRRACVLFSRRLQRPRLSPRRRRSWLEKTVKPSPTAQAAAGTFTHAFLACSRQQFSGIRW